MFENFDEFTPHDFIDFSKEMYNNLDESNLNSAYQRVIYNRALCNLRGQTQIFHKILIIKKKWTPPVLYNINFLMDEKIHTLFNIKELIE